MSRDQICCGNVANPNVLMFSVKKVAGIVPIIDPSFIFQKILGNRVPYGYNNETESPIIVATNH